MKDIKYDYYYYQEVSNVLLEARRKANRSYREIADIVGISPSTMYGYETGARAIPVDLFFRLCSLYNLDIKDTLNKINEKAIESMLEANNKK